MRSSVATAILSRQACSVSDSAVTGSSGGSPAAYRSSSVSALAASSLVSAGCRQTRATPCRALSCGLANRAARDSVNN
jgi:hypothetical protein